MILQKVRMKKIFQTPLHHKLIDSKFYSSFTFTAASFIQDILMFNIPQWCMPHAQVFVFNTAVLMLDKLTPQICGILDKN
uniref:Uncharacterized protein n=1 Tax=Ciona intestinalis TaxID=7719 RepID=H2Y163_CIOIN